MNTDFLDRMPSKLQKIPKELIEAYKKRQITSFELAEKSGMNASYLRRAIKREPAPPRPNKSALIAVRREYRASLAARSATDIANLAHVSLRTAQRIRQQARKLAPEGAPDETS